MAWNDGSGALIDRQATQVILEYRDDETTTIYLYATCPRRLAREADSPQHALQRALIVPIVGIG